MNATLTRDTRTFWVISKPLLRAVNEPYNPNETNPKAKV